MSKHEDELDLCTAPLCVLAHFVPKSSHPQLQAHGPLQAPSHLPRVDHVVHNRRDLVCCCTEGSLAGFAALHLQRNVLGFGLVSF